MNDPSPSELARRYCPSDEANYDRALCEEAQHYFKAKQYDKSAEIFARSRKPFEDVSLMFMEVKSFRALRKYLMIRLEEFNSKQMTQLTMILAWLLEMIIFSISDLQSLPESDQVNQDLNQLRSELDQLFESKKVVNCLKQHSKLFYGIVRNYPNWDIFIRMAKLIGDYEQVIQCHMDLGEYKESLELMRMIKRDDLYYKYGHILMKRMAKELVDALMEHPTIVPTKLIPILIQENPYYNKRSETIRYLEFCIKTLKNDSKVIHNYLFELYARHRDEATLMDYLENEVPSDGTQQYYLDLQLCLRLCTELKLVKTCVVLYSYMGLFDEAVHLALEFDVELAKSIAKKTDSDEHQKRLWLSIAESVLTKDTDIRIATGLLRECRLLKIEDILPFFPDYTTIDYFKDAIRQSLQEYKMQIETLKDGTYDNIADVIRAEIKAFRNRYSIIKLGQKCEICADNIMARTFYVFPCGHLFHNDCIIREIIALDPQFNGIEEKLRQLAMGAAPGAGSAHKLTSSQTSRQQSTFLANWFSSQSKITVPSAANSISNKEHLVAELDQVISSECVHCGSLLASYIDKPAPVGTGPRAGSEANY